VVAAPDTPRSAGDDPARRGAEGANKAFDFLSFFGFKLHFFLEIHVRISAVFALF
jgi:hypothetical protein